VPHPSSILFATAHGPATPLGLRYDTVSTVPNVNEAAQQDAASRLAHQIKPVDNALGSFGVGTRVSSQG
jgi:hypothetical protein